MARAAASVYLRTMRSKKVYITGSVFFAFVDRNHPKHPVAEAYFRYFAQEGWHLYTAGFTLTKTYGQLQKFISHSIAKEFLRSIYLGNIEIVYPDEPATKAAAKLILGSQSPELDLEQALINVISDRHQILFVCSLDYSQYFFGIQQFSLPY